MTLVSIISVYDKCHNVSKIIHGFHSQHTSTHSDTSAPDCGILAIFFAASTALGSTCLCFRVGMGQMIGIPKIQGFQ